jgi:hypothetical protein
MMNWEQNPGTKQLQNRGFDGSRIFISNSDL